MFLSRLLPLVFCVLPLGAMAHEFWIEPEAHVVPSGGTLKGYFKNGENFKGATLSYFDRSAARFDMAAAGQVTTLSPRAGDSPALDVPAPVADGLVTVVHETTPSFVSYKEWPKFMKFVAHKDFATAEADHRAAGWPEQNFRERYTRHAKALFAVGSGAGADQVMGLKTEFTALSNPYAEGFDGVMHVALSFEGAPRPNAQIEVFARAPDGAVAVTLHRTDADGQARIPVNPGHQYLFDAVVLRPSTDVGDKPERPILWDTFWAALTFAVPQQ